jgi:hypothetical protein
MMGNVNGRSLTYKLNWKPMNKGRRIKWGWLMREKGQLRNG